MTAVHGRIVEGGRLIVPARYRRAMGLEKGDAVVMELRGDELRVRSAKSVLRRLQRKLAPLATDVSVVDELIAERRAEQADD